MTIANAVVLFGHGARDSAWAKPLERVRDRVRESSPGLGVELAFLEFMTPTLDDAIDALAAAGARRIVIVPMFIAQGGHLKNDLPKLVARAAQRHPEREIVPASAVGESDAVIAAMAAYAADCAFDRR